MIPNTMLVETIGLGPNLVLIHGWGMNGSVWQPLVKPLSKYFTLHLLDLPGMGYSKPIEPLHLHVLAEKVAEIMPANADLLGWSLGGQVAMRIALDYPDLVRRLVLVGSTPCFVNRSFDQKNVEYKKTWDAGIEPEVFGNFADNVNEDYQKTMMQFLSLQCMGARDARSTVKLLRNKFNERPSPSSQTLYRMLDILLDTDLRAEVASLRKPTLLVHGDRDSLAPVQAAHWMMQNLPVGFLRVMAGASHAPFLSHQEAFIQALLEFLEPASPN